MQITIRLNENEEKEIQKIKEAFCIKKMLLLLNGPFSGTAHREK